MTKRQFFDEKESKTLELKSVLPKFESLIKTCIAFANGVGGCIIVGVEDDLEICGVSEATRKRIYEEFPNSLYDSTSPNLLAQIYEKNFDEHSVVIIKIPQSLKKPCFHRKEGIPRGVYLRVGSHTRRATEDYIEDLMRESRRISYDEECVHGSVEMLSEELLYSAFGATPTKRQLISEKIIAPSSANSEVFFPTIAGTVHFCENPEAHIPEASILCTQFKGVEGRDIIQTQEITGTLEQQAAASLKLIVSWISRHFGLQGVKLKAQSLVPREALREAIINALIHRKYFIPGAVKIDVYEDRVEVFSPGGFPGLVDVKHLGDGTTFLRNPNIARIARRLGLVEKMGTGIKLIFDSCKKAGLRTPEFHEEGDFVKVVFFFQSGMSHGGEEDPILELVKLKAEITIQEVIRCLGVSRNTATRKLNQLIKQKKLLRKGKGPSVRYVLS
ncbi:MAG: DeoR family transcriptional regulator [Chlamydiae bacterium]|nr:DeoR family transcriptional regulator [Chlamydiota bacterium]